MHHLYPVSKGDQLCPLGFHPQVRWPTRCKRCFRDYKDHGAKKGDDIAASSPSLSDPSRTRAQSDKPNSRSWTSTSNLTISNEKENTIRKRPSSWTSTPDLDDSQNVKNNVKNIPNNDDDDSNFADVEVQIPLPRRRHTTTLELTQQAEESFTLRRPPLPPKEGDELTILRTDSLAERVRKMQLLKKQNSLDREIRSRQNSIEKEPSPAPAPTPAPAPSVRTRHESPKEPAEQKRSFSVGRELKKPPKSVSSEVTKVEDVAKLNAELVRSRQEISDKNEIAMRRLAFTEKGATMVSNDASKLQFKINDLSRQLEDLKYEKLHLTTKIKDLEKSLSIKASRTAEEELKKKLQAAEQLCEELMDENAEIKKELKGMEDEIDEMQDNFREDQANEYSTLKKELEMTTKNCRILSFKLKKSERKIEQMEVEKQSSTPAALINQIKQLEEELKLSNDRLEQMQIEAEKAQKQSGQHLKPMLSAIGKSNSADNRYSRASLIRSGSQDDPEQLRRDLQDSIEREADIREQLKFAEEEAESLRKKVLRIEDENESMMVQLKKMATKARKRKLSPTAPNRLTVDSSDKDKDEGISDSEDPAELRVLLDLNEQETAQLRRKVDELEQENKTIKSQLKDVPKTPTMASKLAANKDKEIVDLQKKVVDLEKESKLLRKTAASKVGTQTYQKLEDEKKKTLQELKEVTDQVESSKSEIKNLKSVIAKQETRCMELEKTNADIEAKKKKALSDVKSVEEKLSKQETLVKQLEATKSLSESQEKERLAKVEKELEAERKEKKRLELKVTDIEVELTSLRKKTQSEKQAFEKEIASLKLQKDSQPSKKLDELRKQNTDLQTQCNAETKKLTAMTSKYEQLEEQHVFTKAQLASDKETLQTTNNTQRAKIITLETELERFKRDNIDLSRKIVDVQNKCKDLESKSSQITVVEHERKRLLASLQEKNHQYELLVSENEMNKDLSEQWKKENDELRKKLGDFNKVSKVQASLNDHSSSLEQEIKQLRAKLESAAMTAKSDISATKLRYEQQVYNLQTEISSQQKQCERFKRDRDSFKQLLEAAKKTIKDLKANNGRTSKASIHSGDEDDKSKILTLEQKIGTLEDELCEARLETSKLKSELVSEKTVSEIKLSELQSRINEHEEERLLGSGRTKIPGMKTKLELSWQKEREESQRLLQETSTLARDLRQTLLEVERERDKERLENRRKIEQLERNTEEDLDESRKKIAELQCDLLELRDAHAKLRTSNEKLRMERERYERERDNLYRRGVELNLDRRINTLLQLVDDLVKVSPESIQTSILKKPPTPGTPSSQKRLVKSNSLERQSPAKDMEQISHIMGRLVGASEDIRQFQKNFGEERERERLRRSSNMRRATSIENGVSDNERPPIRITRNNNGSLYRKSLSFDQSVAGNQKIWKNPTESNSSIGSMDSEIQFGGGGYSRDSSMDSRLSGGSTQSDLPRTTRKKKRSLMGKLKNLTRGSSKADTDGSQVGSDSDISLGNYDHKTSKSNLKERISDMFKRSASQSRNDSEDGGVSDSRSTVSISNKKNTPNLSARARTQSPAITRTARKS